MLMKIKSKSGGRVFIDDSQPNADAANKLGIKALKCTTLSRLNNDLAKYGIIA